MRCVRSLGPWLGVALLALACTATDDPPPLTSSGDGGNSGVGSAGDGDGDGDGDSSGSGDTTTDGGTTGQPDDGVVEDPASGRIWHQADVAMGLSDAQAYCDNLVIGDLDAWRLPTITDLRSSVADCPSTQIGGDCLLEDEVCVTPDCGSITVCPGCAAAAGVCYQAPDIWPDCAIAWNFWSSSLCLGCFPEANWGLSFTDARPTRIELGQIAHVRCTHGT